MIVTFFGGSYPFAKILCHFGGFIPAIPSKDKSLQCSNWDQRPLSPEQICCSAADGAEVLLLFIVFLVEKSNSMAWQEEGTGNAPRKK